MPSLGLNLYSAVFKTSLRHRFKQAYIPQRGESHSVPPNAGFSDGVATKDVIIDHRTGLSVRVFLPDFVVQIGTVHGYSWMARQIRSSFPDGEASEVKDENGRESMYKGYIPVAGIKHNKIPIIVQFHSGAFVVGRKDTVANDRLCRRLARMCNAIVIAVDYRLAPEFKCPAAYDDGYEALRWLDRQSAMGANETSPGQMFKGSETEHIADLRETARSLFPVHLVDPWLAAHADFTRVVLLGGSAGGNIVDQVTRRSCATTGEADLGFVKIVGQVLLYPLFSGKIPTPSEVIMAHSSLFFDKATMEVVWQLFLPKEEYSLDHPCVNPLNKDYCPLSMPATLIVTADQDMLRDRGMAYADLLRRLGVDAQVNNYKDVVHGFATAEQMIDSPQAIACVEDISVWMHKRLTPK